MSSTASDCLLPNPESDSDSMHLQELNNQLRQMNEKLIVEVTSLRNQFKEATEVSDQLQKIHQLNTQISSDYRKVSAERDDLSHRLEISLQMNEELHTNFEKEKQLMEESHQMEMEELKKSLDQEKYYHDATIDDSNVKIETMNERLKYEQSCKDKLDSTIAQILEAAREGYSITFSTADQLIHFLNHAPKEIKSKQIAKEGSLSSNLKKLTDEKNKYKQKAHDERKARQQSDLKHIEREKQLQQQIEDLKSKCSSQNKIIDDLHKNVLQLETDQKKSNAQAESQIKSLQNILDEQKTKQKSLENQVNGFYTQPNPLANENSALKSENAAQNIEIQENHNLIDALKKQNSSYQQQVQMLEANIDAFQKKYEKAKKDVKEIQQDNDKLKNENSFMKLQVEELTEQKETVVTQMQAAKTSYNQSKAAYSEIESKYNKASTGLGKTEAVMENQKQEISQLLVQRSKLIKVLRTQSKVIEILENNINNLSKTNQEQKEEIIKRSIQEPVKQEQEIIPTTCWYCVDFPSDLCQSIAEIARNDSLQTSSKLRHILPLIAKYYTHDIEELNSNMSRTNQRVKYIFDALEQFFVTLGNILERNLNLDTIVAANTQNEVLGTIQELRDLAFTTQELNRQLMNGQDNLFRQLKASSYDSAADKLSKLISNMSTLQSKYGLLKAKAKKQRTNINKLKTEANRNDSSDQSSIHKLQEQNDKLTAEKNKIQNTLKAAQIEISVLKDQIADLEQLNDNKMSNIDSLNQETIDQINKSHKAEIDKLNSEIRKRDQIIDQEKVQLSKLEKEVSQWRKSSDLHKSSRLDKENQLTQLQDQLEQSEKDHQVKLQKQESQLRETYESIISQIKAKNNELRDLVKKVSKALDESEARNQDLLAINTQLSSENQHNISKVAIYKEEQQRSHQLVEAKISATRLSTEIECNNQIEDFKAQFEQEKRNIYGFVASSFRQFFSAKQQLDDFAFKQLIQRTSEELNKLMKADEGIRRLLGISTKESTEDAVAQYMLSMYHNK